MRFDVFFGCALALGVAFVFAAVFFTGAFFVVFLLAVFFVAIVLISFFGGMGSREWGKSLLPALFPAFYPLIRADLFKVVSRLRLPALTRQLLLIEKNHFPRLTIFLWVELLTQYFFGLLHPTTHNSNLFLESM